MKSNIQVRELGKEDIKTIISLSLSIFGESLTEEVLTKMFESEQKEDRFFGLRYRGQFVAFVQCILLKNNRSVLISKIGVDAKFRRRGFGLTLVSYVKALYCKEGVNTMKLITRVSNVASRSLYYQTGFEQLYVDERFYPDEPGIVFGVKLRGI